MNRIDTDKKLALVHSIRMQNQYNRMKCREREQLIYGIGSEADKRELFSTETAACMPGYEESIAARPKERILSGFRIRFLIAAVLIGVFIYLDINKIDIYGMTTDDLFQLITKTTEIKDRPDILNSFDL